MVKFGLVMYLKLLVVYLGALVALTLRAVHTVRARVGAILEHDWRDHERRADALVASMVAMRQRRPGFLALHGAGHFAYQHFAITAPLAPGAEVEIPCGTRVEGRRRRCARRPQRRRRAGHKIRTTRRRRARAT